MRQLNRLQSALFLVGGMLMVAGAGCFAAMWQRGAACWVFLVGACLFAAMQTAQAYDGTSTAIRRLKGIMTVADIFFVAAGILMVEDTHRFAQPLFSSYASYLELVYNKWVLMLLIAALLEIYTMHRIASELKKEQDKADKNTKSTPESLK